MNNIFFLMSFSIAALFLRGSAPAVADDFEAERNEMVALQIEARGVDDEEVLRVMRKVKRHLFVPEELRPYAYYDRPLAIGHGQTISQPYIVAFMTEIADIKETDKVLEIGTGSGYQAAVLAELAGSVFTIEIIEELAETAAERLKRLGYENITVKCGDGYKGWPEKAPFDVIMVTAAPREMPGELTDQLARGGRMVIPLGDIFQELYLIEKTGDRLRKRKLLPVRFVPMVHP